MVSRAAIDVISARQIIQVKSIGLISGSMACFVHLNWRRLGLKQIICDGVIQLAIRKRNARVQILQENIDGMRNLKAARAFEHAAHPGGSTGLLVKDYRGKNGEKEYLRFDAVLVAQMNDTLKQAAIEEGQWTEKRETTGTNINVMMEKINSGRKRVAEAKLARDQAAEGSKK